MVLTACSGDTALSVYLEANATRLSQPLGGLSQPTEFTVDTGSLTRVIADNLSGPG